MIEHRVALGDLREQERANVETARLEARTPEQIAEDEARAERERTLAWLTKHRPPQRDRLPAELTRGTTLEFLALLGPDLAASGEALLRRAAENDPDSLQRAVEAAFAAESLAQHDHGLLVDLVEAYYIDDRPPIGYSLDRDGIRRHTPGLPLHAYWRGPFYAMLRSGFRSGMACLNRILNHAAHSQMRADRMIGRYKPDRRGNDDPGVLLSITGEPRRYAGNANTWMWYRGTGVGPYPCLSALQALEMVCDEILELNLIPPAELVRILLSGCENLAVPALAYGLMVRNLERFDRYIDPFLAEPLLWKLEGSRTVHESSPFASQVAPAASDVHRSWRPGEVVAQLVVATRLGPRPDDDRAQELKGSGTKLFERSQTQLERVSGAEEELAVARKQALAFDIEQYEFTQVGDDVRVQQRVDPQVEAVLAGSIASLEREMEADRLKLKYADRHDSIRSPEPLDPAELQGDIDTAKALVADPTSSDLLDDAAAPAAVAAAVLEGFYIDRMPLESDDLVWAARTLADIASAHKEQVAGASPDLSYFMAFYWIGADRSAARGLPLLLRPDARLVMGRLAADGLSDDEFHQILLWLFTGSPNEARNAASRSLDSVWRSPCGSAPGECFHQRALGLVEQSARHCPSPWRQDDGELTPGPLNGPILQALRSADDLVVSWLNPALRALGAEARSPTCVHDQAAELLDAVLEAHRRARCAIDIGSHHNGWDALFAARAVPRPRRSQRPGRPSRPHARLRRPSQRAARMPLSAVRSS